MKSLVQTFAVVSLISTSAFLSSRAIFAAAPDNSAASKPIVAKSTTAPAKTPVKTSKTKPKAALTFSVSTGKKSYKPGEPVVIAMTVRNVSRSQQVLKFSSGSSFDIVVSPQNRSKPVWQWSHGRMFTQMMRDVPLAAGASQVFSAKWDRVGNDGKAVAPGKYEVAALLTTVGAGVEAPPVVVNLK